MEFFDKLSKVAEKTYKGAAQQTNKIAKEAKLRMCINENKSKIEDIYEEIGKKVYEKHIREEEYDISNELKMKCSEIDELTKKIENARVEILNLKDRKQCQECYTEIEKEAKYCYNCGVKQEVEEVIEKEKTQFDSQNDEVVETPEIVKIIDNDTKAHDERNNSENN